MRALLLALLAMGFSSLAAADIRSMGHDFRLLLSNYHMVSSLQSRCPDSPMPELEPRQVIEKTLQDKLGTETFVKLMIQIQNSDLRKNALQTVDKLWESLESCEDPRLGRALGRIAVAHEDAFARLVAEPALVKPKPTPIPLRQK